MLRPYPSISNEHREIGKCRPHRSSARMIIGKQTKIREVESRANCTADERIVTHRPRCLPDAGTDRANRCVCAAADWGQAVAQDGLTRRAELQQFQRATLVEVPDLVRCDLMPPTEGPLREEEVDRRQRGTGTASIHRVNLNYGPEYLAIKTALGVRLQIQRCYQLSGSRVHR
jgi:hypothetical protein